MNNLVDNSNLMVKEVNYNGIIMLACKDEDETIRVGVRSICEGLGIDYAGQMQRIGRDDVLPEGVCKIHIPSSQGIQDTNMMDINYLPFFLVGIKASMCRSEVQSTLKEFKVKAKDVLAAAFINPNTDLPSEFMNDPIMLMRYEQIKMERRLAEVESVQDDAMVQIATVQEQAELAHKRINSFDAIDPEGTPRQQLVKLIKRYSEKNGLTYDSGWNKFRESYNIAFHTNIQTLRNNYMKKNGIRKMTMPEYLEATNKIDDALRVAYKMLHPVNQYEFA